MLGLAALLAVVLLVLRDDTYVAQAPETAATGAGAAAQPAEAARALEALAAALAAGDAGAAAEVAPPGDEEAAALLAALADNVDELEVADLSLRYVGAAGPVRPDGTWSGEVDATWAFAGFDDAPADAELLVTFQAVDGEVGVVSFDPAAAGADSDERLPVWLSGPVEVRRSDDVLAVVAEGAGDAGSVERYARLARAAVSQTRSVLPAWSGGLVVEVPSSAEALRAALAVEPGRYDTVAAVTTGAGGSLEPGAPIHVFVNPVVFDGLEPQGAQVVMTHEAVHVATDAPRTDVPLWLLEGFADFVALREVELPVTTTAAQVIAQVGEEGVPAALPGPDDFDTGATHLGATYEAAWLATVVLADLGGSERLVELYQRVSAGADVDATLRDLYGFGVDGLTERWQQRLSGLAA